MLALKFDLPLLTAGDAAAIARDRYGLDAVASALHGEKDRNFLLKTAAGESFVLKIANAGEPREILELQNAALEHLAARGVERVQRVVPTLQGGAIGTVTSGGGAAHFVRLLTFMPGKTWAHANPHTPEMLAGLGRLLGTVDGALAGFDHPAAHRPLKWDLAQASWIGDYLQYIPDPVRRGIVQRRLDNRPRLDGLRRAVIHNDANDYNVLVSAGSVSGLLDFGDMVHTYVICELAIACAYAMLDERDPLTAAAAIVRGYHAEYPMAEEELEALFPLAGLRLAVSVTNSAYQKAVAPDNEYLQISDRPAWDLLEKLDGVRPEFAHYLFRAACGMPAVPHSRAVADWLTNHAAPGRIVEPDLSTCPLIVTDWSVGSLELGNPADFEDTARLTRAMWMRMADEGVSVAIGRYNEVRPLYRSAAFQSAAGEWRSVHIGLDVFMDAGSPVFAPFDGTIHSFANNRARCDYGPCIVLEHRTGDDVPFFTLYGHLSDNLGIIALACHPLNNHT